MAKAITQDRESCQFPFVLHEKPTVVPGRLGQSGVRKRFLMTPLARTQSQRQQALPDRRQRSKTLDIFFPRNRKPWKGEQ